MTDRHDVHDDALPFATRGEDQRHSAYRRGICIDCLTRPHSAGRPRCNECHAVYFAKLTRGEQP
jgi:hypothetical protein